MPISANLRETHKISFGVGGLKGRAGRERVPTVNVVRMRAVAGYTWGRANGARCDFRKLAGCAPGTLLVFGPIHRSCRAASAVSCLTGNAAYAVIHEVKKA